MLWCAKLERIVCTSVPTTKGLCLAIAAREKLDGRVCFDFHRLRQIDRLLAADFGRHCADRNPILVAFGTWSVGVPRPRSRKHRNRPEYRTAIDINQIHRNL